MIFESFGLCSLSVQKHTKDNNCLAFGNLFHPMVPYSGSPKAAGWNYADLAHSRPVNAKRAEAEIPAPGSQ